LSCPDPAYVLYNGVCIRYRYEHLIQHCPTGYAIDANGHCTVQTECPQEFTCPSGVLDPSLNSCTDHYHAEPHLDCGDTAVFIAGLCYETSMSAPVLSCESGFTKVGNECIFKIEEPAHTTCPDENDYQYDATNEICTGTRVDAPTSYCPNGTTPRQIDGDNYCETTTRTDEPDYTCNDGWVAQVQPNGRTMCVITRMENPQTSCKAEKGLTLVYDEENYRPMCQKSTFAPALTRCDNIMAEPIIESSVLTGCSVSLSVAPIAACNTADGYKLEKNKCIKKIIDTPIDDCPNGQYDSLADVCYTHRYISGEYICPEGCSYEEATLNCICKTRTTPIVSCPSNCYLNNKECFMNSQMDDITVCPPDFGYDLAKDMCVHEQKKDPVETCDDGITPQFGHCNTVVKKDMKLTCPYGYTLNANNETCTKIEI